MSNPDAENVIFNLNKSNLTDATISSKYFQTRNQNILNKIEDYYVRIIDAKIPTTEIPFFIMKPNFYSVTIGDHRVFLIPPTGATPQFDGYIYYYQSFLDSLNQALYQAHNANGYVAASPPFVFYDNDSEYLKIAIDYQYLTLNGGAKVNIFFNKFLLYKLPGFWNTFQLFSSNGQDYLINYEILATNYFASGLSDSINYPCIVMPSQDKYISDLLEFQNILITTQTIPISEQPVSSQDGVNRTLKILATIPVQFNNITKSRYITYDQIYPKWLNTVGFGALKIIDIELFFVGDDFQTYPMTMLPSENISIRIQFNKKNLVQNYV